MALMQAADRVGSRREQADATRALLLRTAERLFAERGISEVSNRQIVEAAGQANNSALAYHVGTREDLLRAISDTHSEPITRRTRELLDSVGGSEEPRDHVACLVLPYVEHLASLGNPSWCARFTAQLATDPVLRDNPMRAPEMEPLLRAANDALAEHTPELPPKIAAIRHETARLAVLHTCAEQERAAAETGDAADWDLVGVALTDSLTGLLLAPTRP
ncbi:TetR/AcrR family transcriptional regulator [Saccharopolyspora gloriosae]|uniref:TetR/AcrR family transcriptional regulator n=1 Tax=Saccharopolyspora gloriosae TaxID=455344 RepID=UPI001FB84B80|nr:TetR/AcrR family transcriptional regulator [Saccharopolyspora gloriosae]